MQRSTWGKYIQEPNGPKCGERLLHNGPFAPLVYQVRLSPWGAGLPHLFNLNPLLQGQPRLLYTSGLSPWVKTATLWKLLDPKESQSLEFGFSICQPFVGLKPTLMLLLEKPLIWGLSKVSILVFVGNQFT